MSNFNTVGENALIGKIQEPEDYMIDWKTWIMGVKEECENIQVVENAVNCVQACVFVEMQKWLPEL